MKGDGAIVEVKDEQSAQEVAEQMEGWFYHNPDATAG
jgi:hypothetical protein